MGRTACTEPQCLYSIAIPLLPLWAVQFVQSLSACTVELYLYSPYGLYGLYRASVPVQYSYTSTPPMGHKACTEPRCLYSIAIPLLPLWAVQSLQSLSACTVQLYLYSPMYRTACTEPQCLYSTAIPLLPLWAIQSVQSLSACTVELYLYFPYGPYSLYRASVPVQYSYTSTTPMSRTVSTEPQCLYSTAIPLLPLWAIQSVQSLSTCTVQLYLYFPYRPYSLYRASVPVQYSYTSAPPMGRTACTVPQCLYSTVPVQYSYTSTPPMGRTACTEPQCLYKGALYLFRKAFSGSISWRQ